MASSKDIRITIASALNAAGIEATKAQVAAMAGSVQKSLAEMSAQNRHHWADIKAAWDMGLGAIRKIGGLIQGALRKAFDAEYALTNFKTMLGSIDDAKRHVAELKQFAAETPLTFGDLSQASKTLLAFGADVNDVLPSLKILGDISLGNAEKFQSLSLAFGKVQSEGKLTGVTLKQMIIAGFNPLQEIAQRTGATMDELKDMMEKGGISFDLVNAAMKSATGEGGRFNNAMKDASQTGAGLFSTMQDNWNATVTKFGTAFLNAAKGGIAKIIEAIQKLNKDGTLDVWADKTAQAVDKVVAAAKVAAEWGEKLIRVYRWVQDKSEQVGGAVGAYVGTLSAGGSFDDAADAAGREWVAIAREIEDRKKEAAQRERELREAAKKNASEENASNLNEKKDELAKEKTLEEIFQAQKLELSKKTGREIEKDHKTAFNRRLHWLREENNVRKKLAADAARIEAQALSQLQQAWGWYRDKNSMAAQLQEEKANARAERQFESDYKRLVGKYGRHWRDAQNLSVADEAVRRVAIAREDMAEAEQYAQKTAEASERSAAALEYLQAVFQNATGGR